MAGEKFDSDELQEIIKSSGFARTNEGVYHKLEFKGLMRSRISKILFVCSLYDFYTIVEDGRLQESLFSEYLELNMHYAPQSSRAFSGETALKFLQEEKYDLIIASLLLGNMELQKFCENVKKDFPKIPMVLLASQSRELNQLIESGKLSAEKLLRQRARLKIFHAMTFGGAWDYYKTYPDHLLGIITDLEFKLNGKVEKEAGIGREKFADYFYPDFSGHLSRLPISLCGTSVRRKR